MRPPVVETHGRGNHQHTDADRAGHGVGVRGAGTAQLDGMASDADLDVLDDHEDEWISALEALRRDVVATIERLSRR